MDWGVRSSPSHEFHSGSQADYERSLSPPMDEAGGDCRSARRGRRDTDCHVRCRGMDRSLGPAPLGERLAFSTVVVDRDGQLLRS